MPAGGGGGDPDKHTIGHGEKLHVVPSATNGHLPMCLFRERVFSKEAMIK